MVILKLNIIGVIKYVKNLKPNAICVTKSFKALAVFLISFVYVFITLPLEFFK